MPTIRQRNFGGIGPRGHGEIIARLVHWRPSDRPTWNAAASLDDAFAIPGYRLLLIVHLAYSLFDSEEGAVVRQR